MTNLLFSSSLLDFQQLFFFVFLTPFVGKTCWLAWDSFGSQNLYQLLRNVNTWYRSRHKSSLSANPVFGVVVQLSHFFLF